MAATILIIEDDAWVRRVLAQVLEEAGYQVSEAANGREGLAQFRAQPVDLVLTDLEMPEMNGLELILKLTRLLLNVRVIAISGGAAESLRIARLLGARQTFPKPVDLAALLQGIQYELQRKEDPDEGVGKGARTEDSAT